MTTVHLHLSDQQESRLKQICAKTELPKTQVFMQALKEMYERMFPDAATPAPQPPT